MQRGQGPCWPCTHSGQPPGIQRLDRALLFPRYSNAASAAKSSSSADSWHLVLPVAADPVAEVGPCRGLVGQEQVHQCIQALRTHLLGHGPSHQPHQD